MASRFMAMAPHPETPAPALASLEVRLSRPTPALFELHYKLTGDLKQLLLAPPGAQRGARADELWRSTCFEAFAGPVGEAGYLEFNFAPDERWAAYAFDGYRAGMRAIELEQPWMWVTVQGDTYEFMAHFDAPALLATAAEWRVGASAVIEEVSGVKSYWALRHPPGRPDFHHADGFALTVVAEERA